MTDNHSKEYNMKIRYANKFVKNLGMVDTTTRVYQFIHDENESNYTNIIQFLIIHGLGLCINLDSYISHMFYV